MSFQKDNTIETFHAVVQNHIHVAALMNCLSSSLYSPEKRNTSL